MMCMMEKFASVMFARDFRSFYPLNMIEIVKCTARNFVVREQQDAHEFLKFILECLQKVCLREHKNVDEHSEKTTLIWKIFGGYLLQQLRCKTCKMSSNKLEHFQDIFLDIQDVSSVKKGFRNFMVRELIEDMECTRCKNKTIWKSYSIHQPPNVLTVTLKRYVDSQNTRINKEVNFPEHLDLQKHTSQHIKSKLKYDLYAVIVHVGNDCKSGHYFCYVKGSDGRWYKKDDAVVTRTTIKSVLKDKAYMLFYIRSGVPANEIKCHQNEASALEKTNHKDNGKLKHQPKEENIEITDKKDNGKLKHQPKEENIEIMDKKDNEKLKHQPKEKNIEITDKKEKKKHQMKRCGNFLHTICQYFKKHKGKSPNSLDDDDEDGEGKRDKVKEDVKKQRGKEQEQKSDLDDNEKLKHQPKEENIEITDKEEKKKHQKKRCGNFLHTICQYFKKHKGKSPNSLDDDDDDEDGEGKRDKVKEDVKKQRGKEQEPKSD